MHVSSGVGLGLEERIKVPKATFDKPVCGHLSETHLKQSLAELCAYLEQWVQVAASHDLSGRVQIRLLELGVLPRARPEHLDGQLRLLLHALWLVLGTLAHAVGLARNDVDQLTLLEQVDHLLVVCFVV